MAVRVELSQGIITGVEEKLTNGENFYSFRGIPFAETPKRFQAAVPIVKNKSRILDCTKERSVCFQRDIITNKFIGSEDCLFLNVSTPKLPTGRNDRKFPVMVWIHGGAFSIGSGNHDMYSPEYLVEKDVIVVSINYRLHFLGFLSLPGVPGNLGLRDQLLALRWVSTNISKFNGDANNVTIFGESAGGASVHLHYLSPLSRQFFDKAICQSGVSIMPWVIQKHPVERSRMLAELCGCKSKSDSEILEFLKTAPLDKLHNQILKTLTLDERRRSFDMVFKPFVETVTSGAIVCTNPVVAIQKKNALTETPLMVGLTDKEGMVMLQGPTDIWSVYDKDITRLIPTTINLTPGSLSSKLLGEDIRQFYFGGKEITEDSLSMLADALSDSNFENGQNVCSELHAKYLKKAPQYYYQFCFDGELNIFKRFFNMDLKGASHADELGYLFGNRLMPLDVDINSKEFMMIQTMTKLWTNFAKLGNPTPENSLPFKWSPVKNVDPKSKEFTLDCLRIDDQTRMIQNPSKERIDFWRSAYTKWNTDFLKPKL